MAKTLNTPGVYRFEKDLSEITKAAGTSTGAVVVNSSRGIANGRIGVSSDKMFVDTFGAPDGTDTFDFNMFAAVEFLKESDDLYAVRSIGLNGTYANLEVLSAGDATSPTSASIDAFNSSSYLISGGYVDGNTSKSIAELDSQTTTKAFTIASLEHGSVGENIAITITTCADDVSAGYDWGLKYDNPEKVFKIQVSTSVDGSLVSDWPVQETFLVSNEYIKDSGGTQLFLRDVINGNSNYIYICNNSGDATEFDYPNSLGDTALDGGTDSDTPTSGDITSSWNLLNDKEKVKLNILIGAYSNTSAGTIIMKAIASIANYKERLDCIAVLQRDKVSDLTTADVLANTSLSSDSYSAQYAGWDKYYDTFSDRIIFIPKCITGAVVMARTDNVANTWDAPAGTNRGAIKYSLGQNIVWNNTDIGDLYDSNINTSKLIRGSGHFIWGQKTCQLKTSALDRINVRRLLLYIENSVEPSLLPYLFEGNTEKTRLRITNMVSSFMESIGDGLQKFQVVCDESNNTPQVIDSNELAVDIYVQPTKSIEFIRLTVIVTRTGASFTEA